MAAVCVSPHYPYGRLGRQELTRETGGSHPVALFFLYIFRTLAVATYLLCGFFVSSYVFSVRPTSPPHSPCLARG